MAHFFNGYLTKKILTYVLLIFSFLFTLSSQAGISVPLTAFSKSFAPDNLPLGDRSTLTFTIDNTQNPDFINNLSFTDTLPSGMIIADPANASTTCINSDVSTFTAIPGSNLITFNTGFAQPSALASSTSCTVSVDVVTTGIGELNNISSVLTFFSHLFQSLTSDTPATDTLTVTVTPLAIQKTFTNDPVSPGGSVQLDFLLRNFDRNNAATNVAFTDNLTALIPMIAGLTFDTLISNDCSGSISGVGTTTIDLTGGTIAAGGSCTISTNLSVSASTTPSIYTNTTSTITATVNGNPVVGNMASDNLFVAPVPLLTKEFLEVDSLNPDPIVNSGSDVVLRFTISNPSATSAATDIEFLDKLTNASGDNPPDPTSGFLPLPVTINLPSEPCGTGSSISLNPFGIDGGQGLQLTGGSLAAGDSCIFDTILTIPSSLSPNIYTNITEEVTATIDGAIRTGNTASDTLTVIGAPNLNKAFIDDPVAPGDTVTLEFTINHPDDASGDATNISFTDDLTTLNPTIVGLTASGLPIPLACNGTGTLSGSAGGTLLTLVGASLSPGESCTISVMLDIPSTATAGIYNNTSSGVTATVAGLATTSDPASTDLNISGLIFSKEFLKNPVLPGDVTNLRYTIENLHPTDDATLTFFSDNLNSALTGLAAQGPAVIDTCGGTLSGTTFLIYSGGSLGSANSCIIEVPILIPAGASNNDYLSVSSSLAASVGGISDNVAPANDTLKVNNNLLQLEKLFTDDPVIPGNTVNLRFTLTNLDQTQAASLINFTDDLDSILPGLVASGLPISVCGGSVSGTEIITFSGGSLSAGEQCEFDITVNIPQLANPNSYTNTTSQVTGTIGNFSVSGDAASDELDVINLLLFNKIFDGPTIASGTATLSFTIVNPGTSTVSDISFSDDLESVLPGLVATNLPTLPCGAGSSITGTSFLVFNNGELPPMSGTCSFDVEVSIPASASTGHFLNTTSDLIQNGLTISPPATANLSVEIASATIQVLKRGEIVKPILKAALGDTFTPEVATGFEYDDVAFDDFNAAWIEKFKTDGYTEGCALNRFCPEDVVTKEQLAKMISKVKNLMPSTTTHQGLYTDVPDSHPNFPEIEALSIAGFTTGCSPTKYCPQETVTIEILRSVLNAAFP